MRVEIENYRGWDISFNTDTEKFYVQSNEYDKGETKNTYASVKTWVDNFIKDNQSFKPFWVERLETKFNNYQKIKIIGIRKDGRFIYEGENGKKEQISDYNESYYILYNEENEIYKEQIKVIREEINVLEDKIKNIESQIKSIQLKNYKKQLIK